MKKMLLHTKVILKHKWYVGRVCFKLGIPWQGLIHDLSKFHPAEFKRSIRYFDGTRSPVGIERQANEGISQIWLHHKRNPHHYQYWVDFKINREGNVELIPAPIPYRYFLEMVADNIGAHCAYTRIALNDYPLTAYEKWYREQTLKYRDLLHPETILLHEKACEIFKNSASLNEVCKKLKNRGGSNYE